MVVMERCFGGITSTQRSVGTPLRSRPIRTIQNYDIMGFLVENQNNTMFFEHPAVAQTWSLEIGPQNVFEVAPSGKVRLDPHLPK
jgi:hypothetical protein